MGSENTLANVLSILALALSGITTLATFAHDRKTAKKEHEFAWLQEIYREYMLKKIPIARAQLHIPQNGKLDGTEPLIELLNQLRRDSLCTEYLDQAFFNTLKGLLQDLEDYLISSEDRVLLAEAQLDFWETVDRRLHDIYDCILKKF